MCYSIYSRLIGKELDLEIFTKKKNLHKNHCDACGSSFVFRLETFPAEKKYLSQNFNYLHHHSFSRHVSQKIFTFFPHILCRIAPRASFFAHHLSLSPPLRPYKSDFCNVHSLLREYKLRIQAT